MKFSLLHLNIEKDAHLEKVRNLVLSENPDAICLVEIFQVRAEQFAKELGYEFVFSPLYTNAETGMTEGSAILSKLPILSHTVDIYSDQKTVPTYTSDAFSFVNNVRPPAAFLVRSGVLSAQIRCNNKVYTIATTHLPAADYEFDDYPEHVMPTTYSLRCIMHVREYYERLLSTLLETSESLIFTADLNSPRGLFIYDDLAHHLNDCVPEEITTTIDPTFHKAGALEKMVDTIMTTPDVECTNFRVIDSVSDHKAFLAEFE